MEKSYIMQCIMIIIEPSIHWIVMVISGESISHI